MNGLTNFEFELNNAISFNSDINLTGDFNINFLEKLQESHVVQYSVSDHYPVCMTRSEHISVKKDTHISIVYRNYNKFVESEFLKDLSYAPFNKDEYVEDPNDALKIWYNLFNEILNKHAPIVTKRVKINNLNGIIQKFSMPDK